MGNSGPPFRAHVEEEMVSMHHCTLCGSALRRGHCCPVGVGFRAPEYVMGIRSRIHPSRQLGSECEAVLACESEMSRKGCWCRLKIYLTGVKYNCPAVIMYALATKYSTNNDKLYQRHGTHHNFQTSKDKKLSHEKSVFILKKVSSHQ